MSEHFPTAHDALDYIRAHDDQAKRLSKVGAPTLRGALSNVRRQCGIQVLLEGNLSPDEMTAEILALRYPLIAEARQEVAARQALLDAQGQS
jgi:hypothetical protein